MSRDPKRDFGLLYHEVFDESGAVRAVRREKCAELIKAAKTVSRYYGNEKTGMMETENIKALYTELFPRGFKQYDDG